MIDLNLEQKETRHILYSSGRLIESSKIDYEVALNQLASATRRTSKQVKTKLLNGKRKKLKSSPSLQKILSLQKKMIACGLNAYIVTDTTN